MSVNSVSILDMASNQIKATILFSFKQVKHRDRNGETLRFNQILLIKDLVEK